MKRFISLMMTLMLILSLGVTAFADDTGTGSITPDTGSITITNAQAGQTYAPYKIFDATLNDDETGISYTIAKTNQFFTELFNNDGTSTEANTFFTYTAIDDTYGAVTINDGYDKAALFEYLKSLVEKAGMNPEVSEIMAEEGKEVKFINLPYGYYVITSTLGAAVTIDSANPDAEVQDKNQTTITLEKTVDGEESNTVKVGDTVNFEVTFNAPNYLGEEKITVYKLHDVLSSEWAAINLDSIVIKVDDKVLVKDTDYKVTESSGSNPGFDIEIPWVDTTTGNFLYEAPSVVTITYSAVVQDAAASAKPEEQDNTNTATLTWNEETEGESDETTTKTFNMGFTKVDGDDNTITLKGAEFKLYSDEDCTDEIYVTGSDGVYNVTTDSTQATTIVTPEDGQVVIMGLDKEVIYYLKEIKAPDGYNLMAGNTVVELGEDPVEFDADDYEVNYAADIENNKGVELPSTGGEGTMMLITIGSMVAMAFAVLLITHKKMSIYHD